MKTNKWLIIGLGNQEIKYENNRHNIGYKLVDYILKKNETEKIKNKYSQLNKLILEDNLIYFAKPFFYINESGIPVKKLVDEFSINLNNILIIVDDMNLDIGNIRIREKGKDGGHNGLKSIEYYLSTNEYPRLRIGIGSPNSKKDHINYVLGDFNSSEQKIIDEVLYSTENAIYEIIQNGFSSAMGKFNQ